MPQINHQDVINAKKLTGNLIEALGKNITQKQLCDLLNIHQTLTAIQISGVDEKSDLDTNYQKDLTQQRNWARRVRMTPSTKNQK